MTAPHRPPNRLQRTRREKLPPGAVYVGRPTEYGNPFPVGSLQPTMDLDSDVPTFYRLDRAGAVFLYRGWVVGRLSVDPAFLEPLRGKTLACWCPVDVPCHADVLLELANP